jgi:hypothetical protein
MRFRGVKRTACVGRGQEHCQVVRRVTTMGSLDGSFWVTLPVGSHMPNSIKSMIACGCIAAAAVLTAACEPRHIPAVTVSDLMEDRVLLDGVIMKCNRDPGKARSTSDCLNARIAVERLAARVDPATEAKRAENFEKSREQLRAQQDKQRQEQEAKKPKLDVYSMPVIPVEPAPLPPPKEPQPPTLSQTNP